MSRHVRFEHHVAAVGHVATIVDTREAATGVEHRRSRDACRR